MAESVSREPGPLSCPVCLDTLRDPVTIPCGHSYCLACISAFWDLDGTAACSCPQCRQIFSPRPALNRNTVLVELLDKLKKTTSSPPVLCAGPGEVGCDVCPGRKQKAVQSCLQCLASYCQLHLQPHRASPALQKHTLVKASSNLQEKICPRHDKLLEVYCLTDQQCICLLCVMDEHKGHDIVSAAAERTEKQKQIGGLKVKFEEEIKAGEDKVQTLRHSVRSLALSAQATVEETGRACQSLVRCAERMQAMVEMLVRTQQEAAAGRAEEQLTLLERDLSELRAKHAELTEFSKTEDHIHYLQNFQSFCDLSGSVRTTQSTTFYPDCSFDDVRELISKLTTQVKGVFSRTKTQISEKVKKIQIVRVLKPKTREEHLEYLCRLTADPDTACHTLKLSQEDRKVEWSDGKQAEPRPERFTHFDQVLCREALPGACYWEAECHGFFSVAVSYGSIARGGEGDECKFGGSDGSWSLECSPATGFFLHNNVRTAIRKYKRPCRVGVHLDQEAGTLSFYSVGQKVTRLHKVQTTFSRPLYAGFRLGLDSSVRLCEEEIRPGAQVRGGK